MTTDFENTKKFWASEIVRANLIWPDEHVIRFVKRNFKPSKEIKILDYGCGGGRNAIALAMEGYTCIAMDYNMEALNLVKEKIKDTEYSDMCIVQNEGFEIPLEEGSVDVIIADGSLFYNCASENEIILSNMRKCLKVGGLLWANWRTKRDSLFRRGVCVGEGLYRLSKDTQREECCYFFAEKDEVFEMYQNAGLKIESTELYEYTEGNGKNLCSYFHVTAQNPGDIKIYLDE